jgi:hypothetical protein
MATDVDPSSRRGQRRPASPGPMTDALLAAIGSYGSLQALSHASGVHVESLSVFRRRLYGLRLDAIQKIATVVGLRLARADGTCGDARTIKDLLLAEIPRFGSMNALAKASGVPHCNISEFVQGKRRDLARSTIDKLMVALGLVAIMDVEHAAPPPGIPERKPPAGHPLEDAFDRLRAATLASGKSLYRIATDTGIQKSGMCRFVRGEQQLKPQAAAVLADYLGIEFIPRAAAPFPVAARRCPVEIRDGFPIRVYGVEIPRMTGIAYDLTKFAVERFEKGGHCEGHELARRTTSTVDNPIKSLKLKLKEPGFEPLARVLKWDGRKGGKLEVIDPGPLT